MTFIMVVSTLVSVAGAFTLVSLVVASTLVSVALVSMPAVVVTAGTADLDGIRMPPITSAVDLCS